MDRAEALEILAHQLTPWRSLGWPALRERLGSIHTTEVRGPSGTLYQVEIEPVWDDEPEDVIRVLGAIDDGGIRAFAPLTDDFLMSPDGTFVGE